ncbi:MAG: hypothetical protein WKF37_00815 [Bryobacteraceae bacterium]
MPLCQPDGWDVFSEWRDVPLVTPRSCRRREEIRKELGIELETRPVVLVGGRSTLDQEAFSSAVQTCPNYHFLRNDRLPCFHDLVRACDVVVSKLGYSIAAECIAEGRALLYPPRDGFREERILAIEVPKYTRTLPIAAADWRIGRWKAGLDRISRVAMPKPKIAVDGAEVCAREILERFRRTIKG